jgi:hypothetical protein
MSSSSSSSSNMSHQRQSRGRKRSAKTSKHYLVGPGAKVPRLWTPKDDQVYTILQSLPEAIVQQSGSPTLGGLAFAASQIGQISSLTNIFDQYMISRVRVVWRPMFLSTQLTGSSTFYMPQLWTVVDYDDSATPSNIATLQQYANCQTSMYETQIVEFVPHIAAAVYSGAFTSFSNMKSQWIDAASTGVLHYGMKYGIDPGGTGQTSFQSWTVNTQIEVKFKNVR